MASGDTEIDINNQQCCICLDELGNQSNEITTECNHVFHRTCLNEWKKYNFTCPICREQLPGRTLITSRNCCNTVIWVIFACTIFLVIVLITLSDYERERGSVYYSYNITDTFECSGECVYLDKCTAQTCYRQQCLNLIKNNIAGYCCINKMDMCYYNKRKNVYQITVGYDDQGHVLYDEYKCHVDDKRCVNFIQSRLLNQTHYNFWISWHGRYLYEP